MIHMKMCQKQILLLIVDRSEMIKSNISLLGALYPAVICSEIYQQTLLSVPETEAVSETYIIHSYLHSFPSCLQWLVLF